jgi:ribosomal 50S subunit-recycling heat shock protein
MINGKRIEVRYNDDDLLVKVLQLGKQFQGLQAERVADRKDVSRIDFVEVINGKRVHKYTFSGHVSYTTLHWKMKDLVYGKSEQLRVRRGSENRNRELKQFNEERRKQNAQSDA